MKNKLKNMGTLCITEFYIFIIFVVKSPLKKNNNNRLKTSWI